jgi:hypothetical protein
VREPPDVVKDDLTVRAEHLGQTLDDGEQRLHAGVKRLREQTTLQSRRRGAVAPQGASATLGDWYTPAPDRLSKKVGSLPDLVVIPVRSSRRWGGVPQRAAGRAARVAVTS